jgi:leader peptidase (prepilin peptidase) / N-methyltransferase
MYLIEWSFAFELTAALVGIVAGIVWAPWSSMLIDRPPLRTATEALSLPFRCHECRSPLTVVASLPLVGAFTAGRRCRTCSAPVPKREYVNDLLCPLTGAITGGFVGMNAWLPAMLFFGLLLVPVSLVDLAMKRIPTRLVYPSAVVMAALLVPAAAVNNDWRRLGVALLCGLGVSAFIWLLYIVMPGGMGDGDARLGLILGIATGWFGWPQAVAGVMAGFVLGSVVGVGYGVATREFLKAQLPFGPWLGLGGLLLVLAG